MANGNQNFYNNPAFCQQSEFYNQRYVCSPQRTISPERRHPPVGAHKPLQHEVYHQQDLPPKVGPKPKMIQRKNSIQIRSEPNDNEEMLVDDSVMYQKQHENQLDISNGNVKDSDNRPIVKPSSKGRYAIVSLDDNVEETQRSIKYRYEYIPMQEQANGYPSSPRKQLPHGSMPQEEVEIVQGRIHRYAMIPSSEEVDNIKKNRYALVPVSEIKPNSRYAIVSPEETNRNDRCEYVSNGVYQESNSNVSRKGNAIATQKLHELLATPKKVQRSSSIQTPSRIVSPHSQRRVLPPQPSDPFCTPNKSPPKIISPRMQTPRAQQKLNYTLSTRQQNINDKRNTAVISPICSSPVQSVYSETTFSNQTESWMNLSLQKPPVQATLAVAAIMMILCGGLTAGLCFYMVSVVGRMYYLDFGTISGFACLLLGLLGFRSRNCHWLPNRNYISGYIVLSAFSLLTCAGLLVLLFLQPKPGSPLADVTSGAVCGISGLSLVLASVGVIASYCCKYPPPDNRVQHCVQGFTV